MNAAPHFEVYSFRVPKAGNAETEYEDAFDHLSVDPPVGDVWLRCAVADGATEAMYAGQWAGALVRAAVRGELADALPDALPPLQHQWRDFAHAKPLPWYAEPKLDAGSFAAVLAVEFGPSWWKAVSFGDCCLFQVRSGLLLHSFPFDHPGQFNSRPVLLGTRTSVEDARDMAKRKSGDWAAGDVFLLMTDALAAWFLSRYTARPSVINNLQQLTRLVDREALFNKGVDKHRANGSLQNDDTTLLWIELS